MSLRWRLGLGFLMLALPAQAQVVRGVVTDERTRAPIPGVVVSLGEASGAGAAREVLTDERGEYAVQAGRPGQFLLSAKRVGLRRFVSAPFALAAGAAHRVDIVLAPIDLATALPPISVLTDAPCAIRPAERDRVAALWDEARAALTSSRLALRDRMFSATMVRYTRLLAPASLRVLHETQQVRRGTTDRPFRSVDASELSRTGFVETDASGSHTFFAPDAEVLTSSAFLADHCFSLTPSMRSTAGMVGLAFEPVSRRTLPEIRGTFWLDSATRELRQVDFRYVNIERAMPRGDPGGEVHFATTPRGAWFVSRWYIRMPELAARPSASVVRGVPTVDVVRYKEEGGDVTPDGVTSRVRGASLTGRAMDSTGRLPLKGATVSLAGTPWTATTRTDGYFRLDSLPAGAFTLRLDHPDYLALGLAAAEQDLDIVEGSSSVTALQALDTERLLRRLCAVAIFPDDRAAVRLFTAPPNARRVRLRWDRFEKPNTTDASVKIVPHQEEVELTHDGTAMFCDLPARQPIRVEYLAVDGRAVARDSVRLRAGVVQAWSPRP